MVIFNNVLVDLAVGNSGGALVVEPGAGHDDNPEVVYLNELPNLCGAFFDYSRHIDVVVGDGSSRGAFPESRCHC